MSNSRIHGAALVLLYGCALLGWSTLAGELLPSFVAVRLAASVAIHTLAAVVAMGVYRRRIAMIGPAAWIVVCWWLPDQARPAAFALSCLFWLPCRALGSQALLAACCVREVGALTGLLPVVLEKQSGAVSAVLGLPPAGPTFVLGNTLIVVALLITFCGAGSRRFRWITVGVMTLIVGSLAAGALVGFVREDPAVHAWGIATLGVVLALWAAMAAAGLEWRAAALSRRPLHWIGLAAASLGLVASTALELRIAASRPTTEVVFCNEGGLDWKVPTVGRYGGFSSGMFGLLPYYLDRAGVDNRVAEFDASLFDEPRCLVFINDPREWQAGQFAAVDRFLEMGGTVLLLGDHTNVFGLQDGFNSLLERYGCHLLFDSAYPFGGSWHGNVAVNLPWGMKTSHTGFAANHAIGCSMKVSAAWRRMLVGTRGFSDIGYRENVQGAFLGNYALDDGEAIGDTVLAAWRPAGRGAIAVYGDTSAFQNAALPSTFMSHVLPLFDWLTNGAPAPEWAPQKWWIMGLLVFGFVMAWRLRAWHVLLALLLAGPALAVWQGQDARSGLQRFDQQGLVVMDDYRLPNTGHYDARWNCVGPLITNVSRAGFWCLKSDAAIDYSRCEASAVVWIGSHRPCTEEELEGVLEFERRGGIVILACGYEDAPGASAALLAAHGASVAPRALGSVGSRQKRSELAPRFVEAWPLRISGQHTVLSRAGEDTVAAFLPLGEGGCLAIGDTRFFRRENIEHQSSTHAGNVAFLLSALEHFIEPPRQRPVRPAEDPRETR